MLRVWEAHLGRRTDAGSPTTDTGGLPVPPAKLRVLVSNTADADVFLDTGRRQVAFFQEILRRNGGTLGPSSAVLDFGCGSGRLARWWADPSHGQIFGCDPNRELVRWCRENLPFLNATTSEPEPPLPYPDDTFDFVYALSIFTHLPDDQAERWMGELRRVLKPGGHLLFTVAGSAYRDRLEGADAARFARGESVVQFDTAAGTNLCIVYQPSVHVDRMAREFEILERFEVADHPKETERSGLPQDSWLVRKPVDG